MSDYATRLAARGMGRAAGALLAPRMVPRVLTGAPAPVLEAAAGLTRPMSTPRVQTPEQPPEQPPGRERVAGLMPSQSAPPGPRSPAPAESARHAEAPRTARAEEDRALPGSERIVEREVTSALRVAAQQAPAAQHSEPASAPAERTREVRVSTERVRAIAERQPVEPVPTTPRMPDVPPPHAPRGAAQAEPVTATPVELRLLPPATPPVPAPPAARAAAESQATTIEVRIGRVEVRAPHPPEPGWSVAASPPPAAPAEPAFARMAAARRYLDRGWG